MLCCATFITLFLRLVFNILFLCVFLLLHHLYASFILFILLVLCSVCRLSRLPYLFPPSFLCSTSSLSNFFPLTPLSSPLYLHFISYLSSLFLTCSLSLTSFLCFSLNSTIFSLYHLFTLTLQFPIFLFQLLLVKHLLFLINFPSSLTCA